jgi:hypothetical protein
VAALHIAQQRPRGVEHNDLSQTLTAAVHS